MAAQAETAGAGRAEVARLADDVIGEQRWAELVAEAAAAGGEVEFYAREVPRYRRAGQLGPAVLAVDRGGVVRVVAVHDPRRR